MLSILTFNLILDPLTDIGDERVGGQVPQVCGPPASAGAAQALLCGGVPQEHWMQVHQGAFRGSGRQDIVASVAQEPGLGAGWRVGLRRGPGGGDRPE